MVTPSPHLLLDIAARIDFEPGFRAHVAADPLVALTGAGLDPVAAMALVDDGDVAAFTASVDLIAARAYHRAMTALRAVEGGDLTSG